MSGNQAAATVSDLPQLQDVRLAADRIRGQVHETPILSSRSLGCWLKTENLQKGGSFKIRGALNKVLSLPETVRARGVVAFSSGNHAQGVAIAAHLLGIPATVVMPEDALPHKVAATRSYGAEVVQKGVGVQSRGAVAAGIARERDATLVPPYDDPYIIAGQGTVGLEIVAQLPDVDAIVVPLGGGGLLAGVALAARSLKPDVKVYGVEPAAGDDGRRSLQAGRIVTIEPPQTLADGARTQYIGERNFAIIRKYVEDIVTVDDDALLEAVWLLASRAKLVVEPTGALGVAALLRGVLSRQGKICVVLSGGNISAEVMIIAAQKHLTAGET